MAFGSASAFRVGVVGFSRPHFDHDAARELLAAALDEMLARHDVAPGSAELVSGLTNMGVPKLAYELASERGLRTVGLSAKQALKVGAGVYPVAERILVGRRFGDESPAFVAHIDVLVRIGGGRQSRREVDLFRAKLVAADKDPATHLIEHEVEWFGS